MAVATLPLALLSLCPSLPQVGPKMGVAVSDLSVPHCLNTVANNTSNSSSSSSGGSSSGGSSSGGSSSGGGSSSSSGGSSSSSSGRRRGRQLHQAALSSSNVVGTACCCCWVLAHGLPPSPVRPVAAAGSWLMGSTPHLYGLLLLLGPGSWGAPLT